MLQWWRTLSLSNLTILLLNHMLTLHHCKFGFIVYCIIFTEQCIQWIQHDNLDGTTEKISDITLKNVLFNDPSVFELYGTATLQGCFMHGQTVLISLYKNSVESSVPFENITSHSATHSLQLIGTTFDLRTPSDDWGIHIRVVDCVRGIVIRNCTFIERSYYNEIYINLGAQSSSDNTISTSVLINKCFYYHYYVVFQGTQRKSSKFSFLFVQMNNVVFEDSLVNKDFFGDMAVFVVENCSFVGVDSRPRALHLMDVVYVSVSNCEFQTYNLYCQKGCAVSVRGVSFFPSKDIFSKVFSFTVSEPILIINNSHFIGSTADLSGGSVGCMDAVVKISNTVFRMTVNSKPPQIGAFIDHFS